jgi:glycosyltransferase involved in cell wall biosynthesis
LRRYAVILSTYNQPAWLQKVLWGYAVQTLPDFELIVADDGSAQTTIDVIDRARPEFAGRLRHLWHQDRGFRKCEILNKAIAATDADYIIFSDGDCIPRADFVETHARHAEPGRFLSGGVIWLPLATSERVTEDDIRSGRIATTRWLIANGWTGGRHRLRLVRGRLAAALDRLTPTAPTFNGHNASVWRTALIEANGFENEMGYGGLDRALGERLQNLGLRGRQVRFRAVCFHLDHPRGYRNTETLKRNQQIRERIRTHHETRARSGIAELHEIALERSITAHG